MEEKPAINDATLVPPTEVPLVHFTIRQMLLFVAVASVMCMVLVSLEGRLAVIVGIGVVLVVGHVMSTVIGSRLRAGTDAVCEWKSSRGDDSLTPQVVDRIRPLSNRPSQLQVRTTCSSLLWWFVGAAMVGGAFLGGSALPWIAGPTVGWPGKLIGAISAAMVVGWGALIMAGICGIARRSWRVPLDDSRGHRR